MFFTFFNKQSYFNKVVFSQLCRFIRLDYRLCDVMLDKVLDFQKNIDVSNRYIGRHRCTLPIYRIEKKKSMFFSKWTPLHCGPFTIISNLRNFCLVSEFNQRLQLRIANPVKNTIQVTLFFLFLQPRDRKVNLTCNQTVQYYLK